MKLVPLMKLVLYMVAMAVEQRSNSFKENSLIRKIEFRNTDSLDIRPTRRSKGAQ